MKIQLLFALSVLTVVLDSAAQTVDSVITNRLVEPYGVTAEGNAYYLTDSANDRIVKFIPDTGVFSTLAGFAGRPGSADGKGVFARFYNPRGLVSVPARGGLVVADYANHTIRLVKVDGTVTTLAGVAGIPGSDLGAVSAASARFNYPSALATDSAGNVYIADSKNKAIRKLDLNNLVTTLATGFNEPDGVAVGDNGDVWVSDSRNHTIKIVRSNGAVDLVAGTPGQSGYADSIFWNETLFNNPTALLWLGPANGLLVSDSGNHALRTVVYDPEVSGYSVSTFAGSPTQAGFVDAALRSARFKLPMGLAKDPTGGFLVADMGNHALRRIQTSAPMPPVADPVLGYVAFEKDQFGELLARLVPVTQAVFNNDVTIAIKSEAATETYYTFGTTPPSALEDTIPAPSRLTGNSPPVFRDGMLPSEVPPSIVSPQQDLTIKVIGVQDGRRPSAIVQGRFQFKTGNPSILGNNAASFEVNTVTTGAELWYTIDGSEPTVGGPTSTHTSGGRISLPRSPAPIPFQVRAFRSGYKPSEIAKFLFQPDDYEANSITFGFGQGEASSDFVAGAGQTYYAPVTLLLLPDEKIYSLQFNLAVQKLGSAPAIETGALGFDSMLVKPVITELGSRFAVIPPLMFLAGQTVPPELRGEPAFGELVFTNSSINLLGIGWLERSGETNLYDSTSQDLIKYSMAHDTLFESKNGKVVVGGYHFQVPAGAQPGDSYQIDINRPSGTSDGIRENVYIETTTDAAQTISSRKTVRLGIRQYIVGDVDKFRWFNAGDFGDGWLLNADVLQVFQSAIYGLNRPPAGFDLQGNFNRSDFFDAMDSSDGTLSGPSSPRFFGDDTTINDIKFGDGALNVDDVFVTFRRSLDPTLTWYARYWEGGSRQAVVVPNRFPASADRPGERLTMSSPDGAGQEIIPGDPRIAWSVDDVLVGPGQSVDLPIHSQVVGSNSLRVVMLGLAVEALDGSPDLVRPVEFNPVASLGEPTITSSVRAGTFAGAWLNRQVPGVLGNGLVGHLKFQIPTHAPLTAAYRVRFVHASASPNGVSLFPSNVRDGLLTLQDRSASVLGDGIPDSWRLRYFGSVSNVLSLATADADGDGVTNWGEFKAGTNPADFDSQFRVAARRDGNPHGVDRPLVFRWPSVLNRTYSVEGAPTLLSAEWTVLATGLIGTGTEMRFTPMVVPGFAQFYRVRLVE